MKRMLLTCSVFVMIVASTSLSCFLLNDRFEKLYSLVESCERANNSEDRQAAIDSLKSYWHENEWKILAFVHHDQVEEVALGITKLEQLGKEENSGLYYSECFAIKESLSHLTKADRLSLQLFI